MDEIARLRAHRDELYKRAMGACDRVMNARPMRDMTAAEEREVDRYLAEMDEINAQIARLESGRGSKLFSRLAAYHEAGHALVAYLRGWTVESVGIGRDPEGGCWIVEEHDDPVVNVAGIAGALAGGFDPETARAGTEKDLREAARNARESRHDGGPRPFGCDSTYKALDTLDTDAALDGALQLARSILAEQHAALFALAQALRERGAMRGGTVGRIIWSKVNQHSDSWRYCEAVRQERERNKRTGGRAA